MTTTALTHEPPGDESAPNAAESDERCIDPRDAHPRNPDEHHANLKETTTRSATRSGLLTTEKPAAITSPMIHGEEIADHGAKSHARPWRHPRAARSGTGPRSNDQRSGLPGLARCEQKRQ